MDDAAMLWMQIADPPQGPYIAVFRNRFQIGKASVLDLVFSGDERCRLFLDGEFLAEGPERSTPHRWKKAYARTELSAGEHVLTAEVLCFGDTLAVTGQLSLKHGFFCQEKSAFLGPWECRAVPRCHFRNADPQYGTTLRVLCELHEYADCLDGRGDGWSTPRFFPDDRILVEPELPPMLQEKTENYHRHGNVFIFREYVSVRMEVKFSGCGTAEIRWAEPGCSEEEFSENFLLACEPDRRRPFLAEVRPDILDIYPPDGKNTLWRPFSIDSGRVMEIRLSKSLKVEKVTFYRTWYPIRLFPLPKMKDRRRQRLLDKSLLTLQACCWETFMDCPYYERIQYIGDTRIEALALGTVSSDLRLVEKALRDFADGLLSDGTMLCSFPVKPRGVGQYNPDGSCCCHVIPGFEAIYIQMIHDYARLRRNDALIRELLPTVRKITEYFLAHIDVRGLLRLPGWNFVDWLSEYGWKNGCPPNCADGGGATLTWLAIIALRNAADMEQLFGESEYERRNLVAAATLRNAVRRIFFDDARQCYAEDTQHTVFSEHANAMAMLAEPHPELVTAMRFGRLIPAGIYFSFYVLEAYTLYGMKELYRSREELYLKTADSPLTTMPEVFLSGQWQRSNCHGWSSHMLYHMLKKDSFTERIPGVRREAHSMLRQEAVL